jgi:hypothetical protein
MYQMMVDIETCGTKPGCVVLSIGACVFDMSMPKDKDPHSAVFYTVIDVPQQAEMGLFRDKNTMKWWGEQSEEARNEAFGGVTPPLNAADAFIGWATHFSRSCDRVYSQGQDFDFPILSAFVAAALGNDGNFPWKFWEQRDTRTFYDATTVALDVRPRFPKREGVYHNALDDAIYQAKCIQLCYSLLRNRQ